jgi:hypothetical protein
VERTDLKPTEIFKVSHTCSTAVAALGQDAVPEEGFASASTGGDIPLIPHFPRFRAIRASIPGKEGKEGNVSVAAGRDEHKILGGAARVMPTRGARA